MGGGIVCLTQVMYCLCNLVHPFNCRKHLIEETLNRLNPPPPEENDNSVSSP